MAARRKVSVSHIAPALVALAALSSLQRAGSFSLSPQLCSSSLRRLRLQTKPPLQRHSPGVLFVSAHDGDDTSSSNLQRPTCWNPSLRKAMGALSAAGMAETAYMTYSKLFAPDGVAALCGTDQAANGSGCSSVLDGPYASINLGGTDVPLSALGFAAYTVVTALALLPLQNETSRDRNDVDEADLDSANRIALLAATTAMATFSSFLMSILFGVLHESCPFCIASAALSISLGVFSWSSGIIPPRAKRLGAQTGLYSFGVSTVAALFLFFSANDVGIVPSSADDSNDLSSTLMASTAKVQQQQKDFPPPPITTHSSDRAIKLASDLQSLDARMYGAYWCSHCFEQKERMGLEAMQRIPYIECSKEGRNSQNALCKERDVPGYPTWEVGGKLFPGEQELDELEDIVKDLRTK